MRDEFQSCFLCVTLGDQKVTFEIEHWLPIEDFLRRSIPKTMAFNNTRTVINDLDDLGVPPWFRKPSILLLLKPPTVPCIATCRPRIKGWSSYQGDPQQQRDHTPRELYHAWCVQSFSWLRTARKSWWWSWKGSLELHLLIPIVWTSLVRGKMLKHMIGNSKKCRLPT